jgi:hypothetical protein
MELLESQDPLKRKLIETSDRHKRELEKELKDITQKTEKTLKNALIIGGSLALGYLLVSQLSSSKRRVKAVAKKKKAAVAEVETDEEEAAVEVVSGESSLISQIGTQVLNQATFLLLELAKEKLAEYLQTRKVKDENS